MRYEIKGEPLPVVICYLEDGEQMVTEGGAHVLDVSEYENGKRRGGSVGKVFGRMFSGENLFQNRYTAMGQGVIAFASSFPGSIREFHISPGQDYGFPEKLLSGG